MQKIRVLFVSFAYIIGVYQSKLKSLQDTGSVDVAWLAPKKWRMRTWNRMIPLEVRYQDVRVFPVNIWFLNGINGGYLYPTKPLLDAINQFRPDVLHYEQEVFSLSAFQAAFWANLLRIPFTVFCWENVEKELPFYRRWTTKFVLNTANAIIVGNSEAAGILRKWGYQRKTVVMPQIGVDTNLFYPRERKDDHHVFTISYVGRLVPEKGVDLIFDAAKHLLAKGVDFHIIVCGSGTHETNLRMYAERLNLSDHISWLGVVAHDYIPELLSKVDVVVLPSRTVDGKWKEQFGHVLIEAMAMGIPVIGSDSGAIPEVIGRSDLVFTENNWEELAVVLNRLLVDHQWVLEVSEFLKNRAVAEYSDQRISSLLTLVWREVISGRE